MKYFSYVSILSRDSEKKSRHIKVKAILIRMRREGNLFIFLSGFLRALKDPRIIGDPIGYSSTQQLPCKILIHKTLLKKTTISGPTVTRVFWIRKLRKNSNFWYMPLLWEQEVVGSNPTTPTSYFTESYSLCSMLWDSTWKAKKCIKRNKTA